MPMRRAAPPAEALYSRASLGAPWLVSDPMARPYFIIFERVRPIVVCIAAITALAAVLHQRISLTPIRKLWIAMQTNWRGR